MKKLILVISALLLLLIGGFYFWDLRNEVSEIKAVVTEQAENTNAEKKNINETAEESKEEINENIKRDPDREYWKDETILNAFQEQNIKWVRNKEKERERERRKNKISDATINHERQQWRP